jgi:glycosyltransferase involved in cell wall biosynthesis
MRHGDLPFVDHGGNRIQSQLPLAVASLAQAFRQFDPDVIHLHSSWAGLVGRLLAGPCGLRKHPRPIVVFQPHAWSFSALGAHASRSARWIERALDPLTDDIVCGSSDEAESGRRAGLTRRMTIIDNAVNTDRFIPLDHRAARKRELGLSCDTPVAVTIGRLAKQKRLDVALRAWRYVVAQRPEAQLIVVGGGPLAAELRALGTPNVHWVGRTDRPEWFHQMADVTILSSDYETRSLALLEAMSCGSPVVSTDVEGVRDAILDGPWPPAGSVVPRNDAAALATQILARLAPGHDTGTERQAARDRVVARFQSVTWEQSIRAHYEQLLAGRPLLMSP